MNSDEVEEDEYERLEQSAKDRHNTNNEIPSNKNKIVQRLAFKSFIDNVMFIWLSQLNSIINKSMYVDLHFF